MTELAAEEIASAKVDAAFEAVKAACASLCIKIARLDNPAPNILGLELMGTTCKWPVYVDCDEEQLCLPMVWTKPPESPLAHVSYAGVICIDDGQGLSLDPERRAEIVVHTALKAYDHS